MYGQSKSGLYRGGLKILQGGLLRQVSLYNSSQFNIILPGHDLKSAVTAILALSILRSLNDLQQ